LPLLQGQRDRVGSVHRVPASEIEKLVGDALRRKFEIADDVDQHGLIKTHLNRVEVQPKQLVIELKATAEKQEHEAASTLEFVRISWTKPPSKRRREIMVPESKSTTDARPIRADARARLVAAIAQGRRWLDELAAGNVFDIETIAAREHCSVRKVNMTLSLAFLAPDLVKAAIEGRLPRGIGIARLCDPPAEWSDQYVKLGLARA
jgi:site-specific DNA recombinase